MYFVPSLASRALPVFQEPLVSTSELSRTRRPQPFQYLAYFFKPESAATCATLVPPRLRRSSLALSPCLPTLTLLRIVLVAVRAVMALVPSEGPASLGENLPFEAVCKCFEALVDPNSDRTKKPKMMQNHHFGLMRDRICSGPNVGPNLNCVQTR